MSNSDLQLRRSELITLAALADPAVEVDDVDFDDLEGLKAMGFVTEDAVLDPGVAPIAMAVHAPVVQLRLEFLGPSRRVGCPGWVDGRLAVLAVPQSGGRDEIKIAPTEFLSARLAGFVGLGPRPLARWTWAGDRADLEAVLRGERSERFPGEDGFRLHWRLTGSWCGGRRSVEVLDASDRGIWIIHEDEGGATLKVSPTSATEVWVQLVGFLPRDEEIQDVSC